LTIPLDIFVEVKWKELNSLRHRTLLIHYFEDLSLALQHETRIDKMLQTRKTLFDAQGNSLKCYHITEHHVSHDVAPH
jgi:hypothetical protein